MALSRLSVHLYSICATPNPSSCIRPCSTSRIDMVAGITCDPAMSPN